MINDQPEIGDNLPLMAKAILSRDGLSYRRRRLTTEEWRFLERWKFRGYESPEDEAILQRLWKELMV